METEALTHRMAQHGPQEPAGMGGLAEQIDRCQGAGGDEAPWTSLMGTHVMRWDYLERCVSLIIDD